jgi:hypothetical protein
MGRMKRALSDIYKELTARATEVGFITRVEKTKGLVQNTKTRR